MWQQYLQQLLAGDRKALARTISLIENEAEHYQDILHHLPASSTPVIGITGPPGAGKSTLTDALIAGLVAQNKKVGILCIDPSSPFNLGALLGDRIRMNEWYNHPNVYIRSLATRGSLGGLNPKIIEITDVMKVAGFDYIIIETVGVGQSEIEIAGLADITIVVLVPEAGDEVQTMKAGLMEIADIFVVNKADRPDAETFVKNLKLMLAPAYRNEQKQIEIIQTIAHKREGIDKLLKTIIHCQQQNIKERRLLLLAEKAWHLIQQHKMKGFNKMEIAEDIRNQMAAQSTFNLYQFIKKYTHELT